MGTPSGKIGRAEAEIREEINSMIRDNREAGDIIKRLDELDVAGVTPQNVSAWKQYGYQKWLRQQERIEEMGARMEFARRVVSKTKEEGGDALTVASDTASQLAIDNILAALESFNPDLLSGLLSDKPEKFIDLIFGLNQMRKTDQAAVILQQKVDEYRRRVKQLADIVSQNGVATKDDVSSIFKEAYGT